MSKRTYLPTTNYSLTKASYSNKLSLEEHVDKYRTHIFLYFPPLNRQLLLLVGGRRVLYELSKSYLLPQIHLV